MFLKAARRWGARGRSFASANKEEEDPQTFKCCYEQFDFQRAGNCCRGGDPRAVPLRDNSFDLGCDPRTSPAMTPQPSLALSLGERVRERFGMVPNFFRLAPEAPAISEKLWVFAETTYLDNPLPSLFKERLFVLLSHFAANRYCVARHLGFLVGVGHASGDAQARPLRVAQVIPLLQHTLPRGHELELRLSLCADCPSPIAELPGVDSQIEDAIFALASHVFLQTEVAPVCLDALERLLGGIRLQHLILFLTYVRTAHYWTKTHPELELDGDIKVFLASHPELAACILADTESIGQSPADELLSLRRKANKAEGLLAAIVDSSDDAIISKSLDGVITSWNKGAERLFGYSAEEAIGHHISLVIPADRWDEEITILERIARGERIEHFETVRVRKDGTMVDVSLTISPIRDAFDRIIGASKIARDFTERKQAERVLHDSEQRLRALADALDTQVQFRTQELQRRNDEIVRQAEQLRDLSGRLLRIQDEERRRIARELHDSAGQSLAALGLQLAVVAEQAKHDPSKLPSRIEDAKDLVQHLTQEIRTTTYLLHPPLLDESGLASALGWYVQGVKERSGLDIALNIPCNFERLAPEVELAIFRLVQEGLTNIHRHSGSRTALITICRTGEQILVEIEDHGKGMSPEHLAEIQSHGTGVGIRGMRERLRHFNGELAIESGSSGTKISAVLPSPTGGKKQATLPT
jgi:PAS domain S-box-containing protein